MVRSATLVDLDALTELFDAYRVFYRKAPDPAAARDFLRERIQHGDSVIYLVEFEGVSAGFTQLYPLFSSTRMQRMWLLNDLFVDPRYRGQGLSLQLLEQAKTLCRTTDACSVLLETETTNDIGNQLYPRAGFKQNKGSNFYEWTTDR